MPIKIVDLNKPPTDINAFMGRQSFIGGLKLSLKESIQISEEDHSLLSQELRNIKKHIVLNVPPSIETLPFFKFDLENNKKIIIDRYNSKTNLFIIDIRNKFLTQYISLEEAKTLLHNEPEMLFYFELFSKNKELIRSDKIQIINREELYNSYNNNEKQTLSGYIIDDDFGLET